MRFQSHIWPLSTNSKRSSVSTFPYCLSTLHCKLRHGSNPSSTNDNAQVLCQYKETCVVSLPHRQAMAQIFTINIALFFWNQISASEMFKQLQLQVTQSLSSKVGTATGKRSKRDIYPARFLQAPPPALLALCP